MSEAEPRTPEQIARDEARELGEAHQAEAIMRSLAQMAQQRQDWEANPTTAAQWPEQQQRLMKEYTEVAKQAGNAMEIFELMIRGVMPTDEQFQLLETSPTAQMLLNGFVNSIKSTVETQGPTVAAQIQKTVDTQTPKEPGRPKFDLRSIFRRPRK